MCFCLNSDGLLSTLDPCEQLALNTNKLTNLTPDIFLQIARLSGLTDEVSVGFHIYVYLSCRIYEQDHVERKVPKYE